MRQGKSIEVINILIKYKGALVSGKALMGLIGIECGQCRKPLQSLSVNEMKAFERELKDCGFFEMVNSN